MARTPTTKVPVTPVVIGMTRSGQTHLWVVPYRSWVHKQCRSQEVSVDKRLSPLVTDSPGTERSISMDKPLFRRLRAVLGRVAKRTRSEPSIRLSPSLVSASCGTRRRGHRFWLERAEAVLATE